MAKGNDKNKPMHQAIGFLARRDHSVQELSNKLLAKGHEEAVVDGIIKELQARGYLDDNRYAQMILRHHYSRGQGPQKIRYLMNQNGVSSDIISATFLAFDGDWVQLASDVRQKRFGEPLQARGKNERYKEKSKQMRFLIARGFETAQIQYACESLDI